MIADRVVATREATWQDRDGEASVPAHPRLRQPRRGDPRQRGELPHQEAVHRPRRDPDREPGADMTQLHRPQFGDLVRPRRRDHVPRGPGQHRLHPHPGLQHGRVPPGRLPVGGRGQGSAAPRSSTSTRGSPGPAPWPTCTCPSGPVATSSSSARSSTTSSSNERYFREYVVRYTNARRDHQRGLRRHRGPRRAVQRLRPRARHLRRRHLAVRGDRRHRARRGRARERDRPAVRRPRRPHRRRPRRPSSRRDPPAPALRVPAAAQALPPLHPGAGRAGLRRPRRRSSSRVAELLCENSGRERTTSFAYAVGWTQHSVGAQYIRTAAILQLLLGNIGRPGGGIMALRGHASIQGSTDIPTLYNLLPGYIPMANAEGYPDLATYSRSTTKKGGFWGHMDAYLISLLKAWWGEAATADNDYCFDYLPRISGDHSTYRTAIDMLDGKVRGFFLLGENPAVGSANRRLHRLAMAKLDWLVVRDLVEIESASFWHDAPEIESGELAHRGHRHRGVLPAPAASHVEKDGSFTNTQRLLQWREKALDPKGDCRSDLWFMYHLGPDRPRAAGRLHRPQGPAGPRPDLGLPDLRRRTRSPTPRRSCGRSTAGAPDGRAAVGLHRAQGRRFDRLRLLDLLRLLRRRGQPGRPAHAAAGSRAGSRPSGAGPGRPTGASSTTGPRPTPTAGPGRSASAMSGGTSRRGRVDRRGRARLPQDQAARLPAPRGGQGRGRQPRRRAVHHAGRRPGGAVRPLRPPGRAAARPLRATGDPVRQPAVRPAAEPDPPAVPAARQPLPPASRRPGWPRPTRTCSPPTG